jgi:hypothetical protein
MDILQSNGDFVERRGVRRGTCALEATVRQRGRFAIPAQVVDLTADGCRIAGGGPFDPDSELWVRLPGLESQTARVAWSHGSTSGGAFERPLHPAVVARFLPVASRLTLVVEDPKSSPEVAAEADDLSGLSRRARIMRGVASSYEGPLARAKHPAGGGVAAMIKRHIPRSSEHRREERFADGLRTGPMRLTVAACEARVRNVSASGIGLAVALDAEIGAHVPLAFDGFEPMDARVVWLRPDEAGLSLPPGSLELAAQD